MSENKNKPAYPAVNAGNDQPSFYESGLTKRELFAMAAMQGILAAMDCQSMVNNRATDSVGATNLAIVMADELLKQLEN